MGCLKAASSILNEAFSSHERPTARMSVNKVSTGQINASGQLHSVEEVLR